MNWKNKFPTENRYYETENGILYNGDSLEILKQFPENSIDLVVTSPPYNVGIDYGIYKDNLSVDSYLNFIKQILILIKNSLKDDGRFAINILVEANMKHTGQPVRLSLLGEYYILIKEIGLQYSTIIDLQEQQPHRVKYTAWGSWRSASAPYIYNPKETILIGYKNQWKKINKSANKIEKNKFIELVSGIWKYRAETQKLTQANYSIDLPINAMTILSYENDLVLDPFMGSGTTAVAAEKLNRRWIGVELNREYCGIIVNRLKESK